MNERGRSMATRTARALQAERGGVAANVLRQGKCTVQAKRAARDRRVDHELAVQRLRDPRPSLIDFLCPPDPTKEMSAAFYT